MHILVIRFSSLGDVVLTTSTVSAIKKQMGSAVFLSYLTSSMFAPLLEGHPHIDQVYSFSRRGGMRGLFELIKFVNEINRKHKIDLIIDMHGSLRSLFIRLLFFTIPRISIDKRTFERVLLTLCKVNIMVKTKNKTKSKSFPRFGELLLKRNVSDLLPIFEGPQSQLNDQSFDQLSSFVTLNASKKYPANQQQLSSTAITYQDNSTDSSIDFIDGKKFIAIVPSASYAKKRWPSEKFYALIEELLQHNTFKDYSYIILAGKDDSFCDIFNPLVKKYPQQVFNLQGKTNLTQSTIYLKKALMVVGNDTGLPHIAEAVGTPSIFILGPTGEEFGFYPHLKYSKMVAKKLWCRPCTTNGQGFCIRKQRYCLNNVTTLEVISAMTSVLYNLQSESDSEIEIEGEGEEKAK
ncbi:MAG: glycosyltransferase family 9 protein [Oligoflexia bacterium]|nr:glycosyltransferase family 9 protein [Oligoflexia bacterium]